MRCNKRVSCVSCRRQCSFSCRSAFPKRNKSPGSGWGNRITPLISGVILILPISYRKKNGRWKRSGITMRPWQSGRIRAPYITTSALPATTRRTCPQPSTPTKKRWPSMTMPPPGPTSALPCVTRKTCPQPLRPTKKRWPSMISMPRPGPTSALPARPEELARGHRCLQKSIGDR